jgi:DNA-binding transcriptional MerR regulator
VHFANFKIIKLGTEMNHKKLITVKELSKIISISAYSIRRYVREGIFPAYRLGSRVYLFDIDEIIQIIKNYEV